uniref:Protein TORNADO 1 n=1 Tax=Cucumis melo TaxID=3656 RepID=A0A9I9DVS7_CUCME
MASDQNHDNLESALHALGPDSSGPQCLSFHLSQSTSCCYVETENSMKVDLSKDAISYFSSFLTALSCHSSLRSLEFHLVHWELEQMRELCTLLENNSGIRQVVFRRNRFSNESLVELCYVLRTNKGIKELMFSESGIGAVGVGMITSGLKTNNSLEEFQIWEDSIGSKGMEELSKMVEENTTLKLLSIFDSNSVTVTPLISAVLAMNRDMEVHIWHGENGGKSSKVVEFVPGNSTLRIYRLDINGARRVANVLGLNFTVKTLDMTGIRLKSRWAKEFRWALEQNRSLREVKLSKSHLKDEAIVHIAAGLFKNKHLHNLFLDGNLFSGIGVEHLLCPLSRFSTLQLQANITLKYVTFGGRKNKIGRDGLAAILRMLTTNETLTHLGIYDDHSLRPNEIVRIFRSLEKNASLTHLSLRSCKGVDGDMVLQTIMEMLEVNPWIEDIDLSGTPLQNSGKADRVYQRLGQNGNTDLEPQVDSLDMTLTEPKSCRIFFCGQEYAGKTTLCNSILQNFGSSKLPFTEQVRSLVAPVEQAVRTVGMKIKTFKDEEIKISIWNLAGQHEFHSLHDLLFPGPGSASVFVIISSLFRKPSNKEPKHVNEIEEDLQYWLRFIVSNSKRAAKQCMLPNVTLVLTHHDKVVPSQNLQQTLISINELRDKFQGFLDIYPTVFTVDARSSASVNKLLHHLRRMSRTVLQRAPQIYQLCNELIQILTDWRSENYNKPAMRWKEFQDLCQLHIPQLRIRSRRSNRDKIEMRRKAVATCLHDIGEVIYFEALGFIILDCDWFCGEVLGQLIRLEVRHNSSNNSGFISRKELEKVLRGKLHSQIPGLNSKVYENLQASDLVGMMLKLELCYEQDQSDSNSPLLIPSVLEEGRGKPQRWPLSMPDCIYTGRHLKCDDSSHMFLTPGFFPRLQARIHLIMGLKNQYVATYSLEKYLITININGIYVRVELGGQLGYYIDVLACSTKSLTETLRFIQQLIIPAIHDLCQGIILTESIIRPECVQNLVPPRHRKTQHVSIQQLKLALLSVPADGMYDYQHTWCPVSDGGREIVAVGFDFARDLLSDDDFREVLHKRYHDLYNLAVELQVPHENNPEAVDQSLSNDETDKVEATFGGIAKGVEAVLQRLKIIEQEIKDLKQEIKGLRYYEHRLLLELNRKVNYLVNYNVEIEERRVPNMFYFVRTENYSRRLITNLISGMNALRLHMLCEFRREMHVVEDQIGCEVMRIDNMAVRSLAPYMTKFMKLVTFSLRIGAQVAMGMGHLIPDLSREVAHLADSSLFHGAAGAAAAGAVGVAAIGRVGLNRGKSRGGDIQQDLRTAQQWVVDYLREQRCSTGKDIAEKFGLWRVRYRDDGHIAWICRRHMNLRAHEITEVPI